MKKILLMMAVAALVLASCSSDETVAVNQGDAISFRPLVNGVTRAANGAGVKSAWETGDILYVTAQRGTAKFFQTEFVKDGSGFNSTNKYYWPNDLSTTPITFAAFWGAAYKTWAADGDGLALNSAYTVPDAVASQKDLLFALKTVNAKPADGGVTLNFRHMLSQIVVKVANDQDNLKVTVSGVRIGYLNKTGTFAYNTTNSGSETEDNVANNTNSGNETLIARTDWTKTDDASKNASYLFEQTVSATLTGTTTATALTNFSSWIMMPQELSIATGYTEDRTNGDVDDTKKELNGAYIALKIAIVDKSSSTPILAEQWCYWPIGTTWNPGYRYTYTVNVGSGGYQPTDQNGDKTDLDPVTGNSVIWFQPTCTIDTWVDENYGLSAPIARSVSYTFANGTTKTINLGAGANGSYDITITGLTDGHIVTAIGTVNFTVAPAAGSQVVPTNGTIHITGALTANTTASATSVITITNDSGTPSDSSDDTSMTINIVQDAPTN